jgi:hypothetical protein
MLMHHVQRVEIGTHHLGTTNVGWYGAPFHRSLWHQDDRIEGVLLLIQCQLIWSASLHFFQHTVFFQL